MTAKPLTEHQLEVAARIGALIGSQDNRCTYSPIFVVERKRRVYGMDPQWDGPIVWLFDGDEVKDPDELAKLNAGWDEQCEEPDGHTRTSYAEHWEFVTACFTEQGCKDFLRRDGHNHGETRIYAYSSYRNEEWIAIRDTLAALAAGQRAEREGK